MGELSLIARKSDGATHQTLVVELEPRALRTLLVHEDEAVAAAHT